MPSRTGRLCGRLPGRSTTQYGTLFPEWYETMRFTRLMLPPRRWPAIPYESCDHVFFLPARGGSSPARLTGDRGSPAGERIDIGLCPELVIQVWDEDHGGMFSFDEQVCRTAAPKEMIDTV